MGQGKVKNVTGKKRQYANEGKVPKSNTPKGGKCATVEGRKLAYGDAR